MRAAQARFAAIAPGGVLFDAVKFVPWYSSRSISFLIAVQPRQYVGAALEGPAAMDGRGLPGMGWLHIIPGSGALSSQEHAGVDREEGRQRSDGLSYSK